VKVQVSRSKNACSYYITKGFRDPRTGKPTTKVVERLGNEEAIRAKIGPDADIMEWCRARADELEGQERARTRKVTVAYDPTALIAPGERRAFNCGYLFLQDAYCSLGLPAECARIAAGRRFAYDLDAVLSRLVYGRVLEPGSKRATCEFARELVEPPGFEPHHVYRALEVLAAESEAIQAALYRASEAQSHRRTGVLYYDCTNFFFEIEAEDGFRMYGHSKQHQPLPLVQMGMLMDADGMPLAFDVQPGNESEQGTLTPLEEKVMADFGISKFVVCTDAGLSSTANREFNSRGDRHFVTTQSLKGLKKRLREWALAADGWRVAGSDELFDIGEVQALADDPEADGAARKALRSATFYKVRRVKEKDADGEWFEQNLISTFSIRYRDYRRAVRQGQLDRAARAIADGRAKRHRKGANDPMRIAERTSVTDAGEVAATDVWEIDEEKVAEEAAYDGFYGLATSLDADDVPGILKVAAGRWEIEECFRIMKDEMEARPVYLSREDRIRAHFLTCFVALLVFRVVERRLGGAFTCPQIVDALRSMEMERVRGEGWRPLYTRTEVTDALHEAFGFRTDYEIVPEASMREIVRKTKRR